MEEPWEFVQRKPFRQKSTIGTHHYQSSDNNKSHKLSQASLPNNEKYGTSSSSSSSSLTSTKNSSLARYDVSLPPSLPVLSYNEITEALNMHLDKLIDTGLCGLFQEVLPSYLGYASSSSSTVHSSLANGESDDDEDDNDDCTDHKDTLVPPRIICLGLGSISNGHRNNNGIIQLATVLFIHRIVELVYTRKKINGDTLSWFHHRSKTNTNNKKMDNTIEHSKSARYSSSLIPLSFYDPIFTSHDKQCIQNFIPFCRLYSTDEEWQKDLAHHEKEHSKDKGVPSSYSRTILIMPHCPLRLNALVLQLLWDTHAIYRVHPLSSVLLIGNTLGTQDSSPLGEADSISLLLNTQGVTVKKIPLDTCFNPPICTDPYIHSVYGIPWNSTSLHFFRITQPLGPRPSVYTKRDLE